MNLMNKNSNQGELKRYFLLSASLVILIVLGYQYVGGLSGIKSFSLANVVDLVISDDSDVATSTTTSTEVIVEVDSDVATSTEDVSETATSTDETVDGEQGVATSTEGVVETATSTEEIATTTQEVADAPEGPGGESASEESVSVLVATTTGAADITGGAAVLQGVIDGAESSGLISWGFVYGTTTAYGATTTESGAFSVEEFSADIVNLKCLTTYYFSAYAADSLGVNYGSTTSFTTNACQPPSLN